MLIAKALVLAGLLLLSPLAPAADAAPWVEGKNYFLITPPQPPGLPHGKVEVTEVFSYACIVCNRFLPDMHRLIASLPKNAVVDYVPASFIPSEDWLVFQRAYLTAQVLGVASETHDAMFDAVWKSGELAIADTATGNLKDPMPGLEDLAKFYLRTARVPVAKFLSTANSMGINTRVNQADALVEKYQVTGTPTIIVNGKYRLGLGSAGDPDKLIQIVNWLVAKESR